MGQAYRVTEAGRKAWESKDPAVPSDYRMILWQIDFSGGEHLENWMRNFPDQKLDDCLAELQELGLIEPLGAARAGRPGAETPVFEVRAAELASATASLARDGAYLALERLVRRAPRPVAETVVLIVEDDPDQLALADLRVSMAGYAVRAAESQAALMKSLACDGVPDLLLLDVRLPDGNGFEILKKLRKMPAFASLPIVMLTAKKRPADIEQGLRLGADGYITKPYSKSILATAVGRILKHPG